MHTRSTTRQSTHRARCAAEVAIAHAHAFEDERPTEVVLGCTMEALSVARHLSEALAGDRRRDHEGEVAGIWHDYALECAKGEARRAWLLEHGRTDVRELVPITDDRAVAAARLATSPQEHQSTIVPLTPADSVTYSAEAV